MWLDVYFAIYIYTHNTSSNSRIILLGGRTVIPPFSQLATTTMVLMQVCMLQCIFNPQIKYFSSISLRIEVQISL